jgi:hypothetical protein
LLIADVWSLIEQLRSDFQSTIIGHQSTISNEARGGSYVSSMHGQRSVDGGQRDVDGWDGRPRREDGSWEEGQAAR